jgi:hypothetical protein
MLNVKNKSFMLCGTMLSVVKLSAVVPQILALSSTKEIFIYLRVRLGDSYSAALIHALSQILH